MPYSAPQPPLEDDMARTRDPTTGRRATLDATVQCRLAIECWDGEGGAVVPTAEAAAPSDAPAFADAEVVQLRMRVVALEGLVLALLAHGSGPQRAAAAQMASHILPRSGYTRHPLTIRAAARITQLVDRAGLLASASAP
jgi:hypothetical protein